MSGHNRGWRQGSTTEIRKMRIVKIIALGLLLLPVAEVAAFLLVAGLIGLTAAVLLLMLSSLAGLVVLRRSAGTIRIWGSGGKASGAAASRLAGRDGSTVIAGILLLVPGLITGLAGLAMLQARSREWLLRAAFNRGAEQRRAREPEVVDLSPGEWKSLPEPEAPKKRPRRAGRQR